MTVADCYAISMGELSALVGSDPGSVVCLDVETTGLDLHRDGILSLTIVDWGGEVLFDSLLHTYRRRTWRDAQRVHGIRPADVRDAPSIPQVRDEVESILGGARAILGYNHVVFDLPMLESNGVSIPGTGVFDVMDAYVGIVGPDSGHRLSDCAEHYGVGFVPHCSLSDATATLECARLMLSGASR